MNNTNIGITYPKIRGLPENCIAKERQPPILFPSALTIRKPNNRCPNVPPFHEITNPNAKWVASTTRKKPGIDQTVTPLTKFSANGRNPDNAYSTCTNAAPIIPETTATIQSTKLAINRRHTEAISKCVASSLTSFPILRILVQFHRQSCRPASSKSTTISTGAFRATINTKSSSVDVFTG